MIILNNIKYSGKARTSTASINNKEIRTPFFMPVATKAAARHLTIKDLRDADVDAVIVNSMLLSLKPGKLFVNNCGGIHKFMGFNRVIFADSGGFQVMRPFFKSINNNEIEFYSPYDKSVHKITPEKCIDNQFLIDSDVAMVLDHMPLFNATKENVVESMQRTFEWAKIQKKYHDELKKQMDTQQNLFGIIQGGYDLELRKQALSDITSLDFDGYALGGLAIGETREEMNKVFHEIIHMMPDNKLRYIMGVGHPIDILTAIENGADCFDSVYPTQIARHNHILTNQGIIKITQSQYKDDQKPLDENCDCYVCKNFSRAYIRFITKIDEPIAYQMKSYHNVYWMMNFMKKIRDAIFENNFDELKKKYLDILDKN